MNTPLASIRISRSDCAAVHAGQQFDTLQELDATLRARHAPGAAGALDETISGRVHFLFTWKDGATFQGQYDVRDSAGLIEHVVASCTAALHESRLLGGARLAVLRLLQMAWAREPTAHHPDETTAPLRAHDYSLEPPDEVIAEVQSGVVRSRLRGQRTRDELLSELLVAARELTCSTDARAAIHVAALAIRFRMEAA